MGHYIKNDSLFHEVRYAQKTTAEVRASMERKIEEIEARVGDRELRVERLRAEHDIDAERLAVLVMRFQESGGSVSYDRQGNKPGEKLVPAGVIANLVRERKMIDSERDQLAKLALILRNLQDEELYEHPRTGERMSRPAVHELSDRDLEYLGF